MSRRILRTLVAAGLLLVTAAGCARPVASGGGGIADPRVATDLPASTSVGMECDSNGIPNPSSAQLTPLPADFIIIRATRCVFENRTVSGDGEWMFRVDQRADSGLDALTAALRLPSQTSGGQGGCAAIGYLPIVITVSDQQGHSLSPAIPTTDCGAPLKATVDTIEALPWRTTTSTKVRQTRTQLEIDSGCPGHFKQTTALIDPAAAGTTPLGRPQYLPSVPLSVCRYDLDDDPAYYLSTDTSGPVKGGRLAGASTLDGKRATDFLAAVVSAPSVRGDCRQRQSVFAVVTAKSRDSDYLTVELEGCYRAQFGGDGSRLRQLDAATVAVLGS